MVCTVNVTGQSTTPFYGIPFTLAYPDDQYEQGEVPPRASSSLILDKVCHSKPPCLTAACRNSMTDRHTLSHRRATFVPDAFFGGDDEDPLAEHLSIMFSTILSGLSRVYEVTLPHSRDQATRKLLALAPTITTLRFSHVQPTVSHIELLAEVCPNLRHLWFTLYWFQVGPTFCRLWEIFSDAGHYFNRTPSGS